MKHIAILLVLGVMTLKANGQAVVYTFDAPCPTTCNSPGPDCPGAGSAAYSSINSAILSSASNFYVAPILGLGTSNCASPVFSTSMNGFASGNPGNPSRARWAQGWTTSTTLNPNQHFGTTLTAASWVIANISQITFDESRSGTGPHMIAVQVKIGTGSYTTLWQQTAIPDNTAWRSWSITSLTALTPMPTFSTTIDIRFYGYGSENTTGSWRIDNVKVYVNYNLPIELISFTGDAVQEGVALHWSTATETDNDHFEILRSQDGMNFEVIDVVSGAGTSQVRHDYELLDDNAVNGVNYYKLRQTDTDGTSEEFYVIAVLFRHVQSLVFTTDLVSIPGKKTLLLNAAGQIESDWSEIHTMQRTEIFFLKTEDEEIYRCIRAP